MPIFRASNNQYYLKALFLETALEPDKDYVLYSLKDQDWEYKGKTYPSFKRLYLDINDPSEYNVAYQLFENYTHWKKLLQCNWFKEVLDECREELQIKQIRDNLQTIRNISNNPNDKNHYLANKYLLDNKFVSNQKGRPSKEKIREQAEQMFKVSSEIDDDYERLSKLNG